MITLAAALGLVCALAWNDAIKSAMKSFLGEDDSLAGLFTYAILATLIAVFVYSLWHAPLQESAAKQRSRVKQKDRQQTISYLSQNNSCVAFFASLRENSTWTLGTYENCLYQISI